MTRTSPVVAATAIRTCVPCSHMELVTILHQLQGLLQKTGALGDKCTSVSVDLCDEIIGQLEQDEYDQQAEQSWAGRWAAPASNGESFDAWTTRSTWPDLRRPVAA